MALSIKRSGLEGNLSISNKSRKGESAICLNRGYHVIPEHSGQIIRNLYFCIDCDADFCEGEFPYKRLSSNKK
jgi:hypothetical protein